ncbi:MFS transporter [Nonomuraea sp. NPDC050556]|uniref:MFS transporter n=1 Tax=Nonomuraea sp. NPDC050556 TaxID=3364369 RepID=UPI0037B47EA9
MKVQTNRNAVLAVVLIGAFVILLDVTIVTVAIPAIQQDLSAGYAQLEWVMSGYALAYGLLLVPAGRLGDILGHRRVLVAGLAVFTVASALCGLATTPAQLIAFRVLQGVAAGLIQPPILAILGAVFPPGERGRAFAAYGATAGVATALGWPVGGLLVGAWDWRPIFLINLPICLVAIVLTLRTVPATAGRSGRLDVVGLVLVSAAMFLITYPLVQTEQYVLMAAAVPVLAIFVLWERRHPDPLVDPAMFRDRAFTAGALISLVYFAAFIGLLFLLSIYLQFGLQRSALAAGLEIMPFAVGTLAGSALSEPLAHRLGRGVLLIGSAVVAVGTAASLFTLGTWWMLGALLVAGVGSGLVIAPLTDVVLEHVPWERAGAASGVLNTAQRLGQAIGVAVVGTVLLGRLEDGEDYTSATVVAGGYTVGAVVLTFLLVFVLPRKRLS